MRFRCQLFGCVIDTDSVCVRCQSFIYNPDFVQQGLLTPAFNFMHSLASMRGFRCEECRRMIPIRRLVASVRLGERLAGWNVIRFCSESCEDNWTPF